MHLAMLPLENKTIFTPDSMFTHLKGWWKPPACVTEFWSTGCYFEYTDVADYERKKQFIKDSHETWVSSFWSMMVL